MLGGSYGVNHSVFNLDDATTAILRRWYSVVKQWKKLSLVALPAGSVTITLSVISGFLQVRMSHTVQPPPPPAAARQRYFRVGFLEPGRDTKQKGPAQLLHVETPKCVQVWTAATQLPGCPVASGASFRRDNAANFHRVFTSHISVLQGGVGRWYRLSGTHQGMCRCFLQIYKDIQARMT